MTAALAHRHSHHSHRRKKRHNIYGLVPGPFGMELLNRKQKGNPPQQQRTEEPEFGQSERELKAQMVHTVLSLESLIMIALFVLFGTWLALVQLRDVLSH